MAVQLPTFADLPSLVPQPSGALPSFKPNDPVAEGEANLGQGFQKAGLAASDWDLYSQLAKDKLEEANATVDLFSRVDPLKAQIEKETDPAKVAELKAQANDLLNTSGQAIANPLRRQMWTAQHTRTIGQLGVLADGRNTELGREQTKADIRAGIDKAIRTAVGSDDPQALGIAQGAINDLAQYGRQYGAFNPVETYALTKDREKQLYLGRARALINGGQPDQAIALLNAHSDDIDPITMETLIGSAQTKGDSIVALRAVNQALGRSTPAAVGAVDQTLDLIERHESAGQNVQNYRFDSTHTAQGNFQITNTTWNQFAPEAGVDTDKYPNAMAAPYDVQRQVAKTILTSPNGGGIQHWANYNPNLAKAISGAEASGIQPTAPITRGQAVLSTMPDYLTARDQLMTRPDLNDRQRNLALTNLTAQFHQETTLYNTMDAKAHQQLTDQQKTNDAQLLSWGIQGQLVAPDQLADMVRNQRITEGGYKAYQAELQRQGRGQDDMSVFNELDRRARAGEDVNQDIMAAVDQGKLKGTTALSLQKTNDARKQKQSDQIERYNFSTLRTVAGMDAQEHPMVDLGREAQQAQVALWGQAQQEWNRRVHIAGEDSNVVLADMLPRYGHPVDDVNALPRPRLGAIGDLNTLSDVAQKTQAARDAGDLSEAQFSEEQSLIVRYKKILDAQQSRAAAAASVPKPGSDAARGRVKMQ